jgi:hypothetical protein
VGEPREKHPGKLEVPVSAQPVVLVEAMPAPLRRAECGEPEALSVILTVPLRLPTTAGVKLTEIVQLLPAATVEPHVLVWAKSPDTSMRVTVSAAVPSFDSVSSWLTLAVPRDWLAKLSTAGLREACGVPGGGEDGALGAELEQPPASRQQAKTKTARPRCRLENIIFLSSNTKNGLDNGASIGIFLMLERFGIDIAMPSKKTVLPRVLSALFCLGFSWR